jgi:cell division protein FtsL
MKVLFSLLLAATVFISALQVVIAQHQARKFFVELQKLENIRDELNEEWGRLQLELSTWANDDRIEMIARTRLHMTDPDIKSIVLLSK